MVAVQKARTRLLTLYKLHFDLLFKVDFGLVGIQLSINLKCPHEIHTPKWGFQKLIQGQVCT